MQGNYAHTFLCIRLRVLLLKLTGDEIHLGLRLLLRNTLLEPAHRVKKVITAVVIVRIGNVDNERHPHVDMPGDWKLQLKTGRHHANYRNLMRVERQTLVYDIRIRAKLSLPQFMTDNCREGASGCF